jgi:hypothetical protein
MYSFTFFGNANNSACALKDCRWFYFSCKLIQLSFIRDVRVTVILV